MSSAFDLGSTGSAGLVDPVQTLLSSLGQHPALAPPNRIDHLAALHNAGMFNPNAGPASAAIAAHVAAHALSGMADPMAGVPLTPDATAPSPTLAPSAQVTTPGNDLGSQSPGRSFLDQLASGIADSRLPGPSGYQSNGDQFLTALLGTAMRSFAGAQGQDMSDREKLQNAMEARTSDLNRRNMDLADKKDLMATESGLQAKNEAARIKAESGARTAEDQAKQASSMVTVDRTLANLIGHPEMTGTSIDRDLRDRLIEAAAQRRAAGGGAGASAQGTKQEQLQYRIWNGRIDKMDAADNRDLQIISNPTTPKDVRTAAWAKMTARSADRAGVTSQIEAMEDTWLTRGGGGKAPAAGTTKPATAPQQETAETLAAKVFGSGHTSSAKFNDWATQPSNVPGKTNLQAANDAGIKTPDLISAWQAESDRDAEKALSVSDAKKATMQAIKTATAPKVVTAMPPGGMF